MGRILISNSDYNTSKWEFEFLETLRNEKGEYKCQFSYRIYLN